MRRAAVPALCAACMLAIACDDDKGDNAAPPVTSRVEAVAAAATAADPLAGFCDVRAEPGQGKPFTFPSVEKNSPTAPGQQRPLWLNLWATWCKPCVEELPMIARWQAQWQKDGKAVDVAFVSVDDDAAAIDTFRTEHPGLPETLHIADAAALPATIAGLGLDPGAGLPIHVFVEPGGRVRCVRAGAVTETHHAIVAGLL